MSPQLLPDHAPALLALADGTVFMLKNSEIQLVFNTTEGPQALADSRALRRTALLHKVPYYTTLAGAIAAAEGIKAYCSGDLEVRSLQSYFERAA